METHRNVLTITDDALPKTEKNYRSVNASLIQHSKEYNREYIMMSNAADEVKDAAIGINQQTAQFNNTLYSMEVDLQAIINFLNANPTYGT